MERVLGQLWSLSSAHSQSELLEQGVSRTESEKGQLRALHLQLRILVGLLCELANELSYPPQLVVRVPHLFLPYPYPCYDNEKLKGASSNRLGGRGLASGYPS